MQRIFMMDYEYHFMLSEHMTFDIESVTVGIKMAYKVCTLVRGLYFGYERCSGLFSATMVNIFIVIL